MSAWTTADDIRARARRRWDEGSMLRAYAAGEPFPALDIPLRGPRASEIGERLGAVQDWVRSLETGSVDGRRYDLEYASIGGREFGRNKIPARARVTSYAQAWALLRTTSDVEAFEEILRETASETRVNDWVCAHPLRALALRDAWVPMVAAYRWLDDARDTGRALREITAPGVDTKFVETHRTVLAALLEVPSTVTGFVDGLGLRAKPDLLRLRFDADVLDVPMHLTEGAFRVDELARLSARPAHVLIVENETTYLSVPVPPGGLVIWGRGFDVSRAGALPWLSDADIVYWGDLDTHGFAILDRLRAWLPQVRSVLMDRGTLLAHRARWGREPKPTSARLSRLDESERMLYADLVSDRYGDAVRLEQERIDWAWASEQLA